MNRNVLMLALYLGIALGLATPLDVQADTPYTDTFDSNPIGEGPTDFGTGTDAIGLRYQCSGSGESGFYHSTYGGEARSPMISASYYSLDPYATGTVTITSRNGQAFDFVSIWIDNNVEGTAVTITGYGPEPFTIDVNSGSSGTLSPSGGSKLVTRVELTGIGFYYYAIDTVSTVLYNLDFGDVPDSYGTLLVSNGARHVMEQGFNLGPIVDAEPDGQPSTPANGDDLNPPENPDDEDGVSLPAFLTAGAPGVAIVNGGPSGGMLDAWIDFNGNGVFDHPAEHLWGSTSRSLIPGQNPPLSFSVPAGAVPELTYARFRLSGEGGLAPTGLAFEGEVEDYTVNIEAPPQHTLTVATVGSGTVSLSPPGGTYVAGTVVQVSAVPGAGWVFSGWSGDLSGSANPASITMDGNKTVTATFVQQHTLTVATVGSGTVSLSPPGGTYVAGTVVQVTAAPGAGWVFSGWSGELSGSTNPASITMDGNKTVTATFVQQHTLTVNTVGNGTVTLSPPGGTYVAGTVVQVTAAPGAGWVFSGWSGDLSGSSNPASITMDGNKTVTAAFVQQHIVTVSSTVGGSTDQDGSHTVNHGGTLTIVASAYTGYHFTAWSGYASGTSSSLTVVVTSDLAITANFEIDSYTVTASAASGGSISPTGGTEVNHGDDLILTATEDTGYQVNIWSVDGVYVQTGGTHLSLSDVTAAHTVEVTFFKVHYTVNATAGPGGSISPADASVRHGSKHTFTATADVGYRIDEWLLDGSRVQAGGATYELGPVHAKHALYVTFVPTLSYFLGMFDFEDEGEFETGIVSNNAVFVGPLDPGLDPDNVAMGLRKLGRAKGTFIKTDADEVLIHFQYLFMNANAELVIYVSDWPLLLAPDDPSYTQHYLEVARVPAPPFDLPGSPGSGRFGVFQEIVSTGDLDFSEGLYVELALIDLNTGGTHSSGLKPRRLMGVNGGSAVYIDNWSTQVQCYGICLDINWDNFVDEADFLTVISGCGLNANGDSACLEGSFSSNGYLDSYDIVSWDWAMNSAQRLLNYCGLPLARGSGGLQLLSERTLMTQAPRPAMPLTAFPMDLSDLLVLGKRGPAHAASKLKDSLYSFSSDGQYTGSVEPASDRGNIRLIQGPDGEIYRLNSETGLLRIDSADEVIIPPGQLDLSELKEPRYDKSATVYVGIQGSDTDAFGRPILDVSMDADYVYVVPVVVSPDGAQTYTAAAKLKLLTDASPPYELVELYDEPPLLHDNQYRDHLREIEIDGDGNLYVLNANAFNESDILWRYRPDGSIDRVDLGRPDGGAYVPAPIAMHVSATTGMLYLASALLDPVDPESTTVYGFSTAGDDLALETSIVIPGLQHVTSMTEDPQSGTLWVAGFSVSDLSPYPNPTRPAFYYARLAQISLANEDVELLHLFAPASHDLSLPMSVLWTGAGE